MRCKKREQGKPTGTPIRRTKNLWMTCEYYARTLLERTDETEERFWKEGGQDPRRRVPKMKISTRRWARGFCYHSDDHLVQRPEWMRAVLAAGLLPCWAAGRVSGSRLTSGYAMDGRPGHWQRSRVRSWASGLTSWGSTAAGDDRLTPSRQSLLLTGNLAI